MASPNLKFRLFSLSYRISGEFNKVVEVEADPVLSSYWLKSLTKIKTLLKLFILSYRFVSKKPTQDVLQYIFPS